MRLSQTYNTKQQYQSMEKILQGIPQQSEKSSEGSGNESQKSVIANKKSLIDSLEIYEKGQEDYVFEQIKEIDEENEKAFIERFLEKNIVLVCQQVGSSVVEQFLCIAKSMMGVTIQENIVIKVKTAFNIKMEESIRREFLRRAKLAQNSLKLSDLSDKQVNSQPHSNNSKIQVQDFNFDQVDTKEVSVYLIILEKFLHFVNEVNEVISFYAKNKQLLQSTIVKFRFIDIKSLQQIELSFYDKTILFQTECVTNLTSPIANSRNQRTQQMIRSKNYASVMAYLNNFARMYLQNNSQSNREKRPFFKGKYFQDTWFNSTLSFDHKAIDLCKNFLLESIVELELYQK